MSWRRLQVPGELPAEFKGKTRFLVDEDLGPEVAEYVRSKGFNALSVENAGLIGHSHEDCVRFCLAGASRPADS